MPMTGIDPALLKALHAERFADLPFDCERELDPGIEDTAEWRDWSAQPTTPDQLRIEAYIDAFDLRGKSILHVGAGTSRLGARFARRARRIVGTTVVPGEVRCGRELGIGNYRVLLQNKYRGSEGLEGEAFDFIVDNNPATFACCLTHFARMMEAYAALLNKGGRVVTDRIGLGWTTEVSHPRWGFSFDDLSALVGLAGLDTYSVGAETIVLAREAPSRPSILGRSRRLLRRMRRALARLAGRRAAIKGSL